jgi:hypothetical protein
MKIHLHFKEKVLCVSCGSAEQPIEWLGQIGKATWDSDNGELGVTQLSKHPNGYALDMGAAIKDVLNDSDHVRFKDELIWQRFTTPQRN